MGGLAAHLRRKAVGGGQRGGVGFHRRRHLLHGRRRLLQRRRLVLGAPRKVARAVLDARHGGQAYIGRALDLRDQPVQPVERGVERAAELVELAAVGALHPARQIAVGHRRHRTLDILQKTAGCGADAVDALGERRDLRLGEALFDAGGEIARHRRRDHGADALLQRVERGAALRLGVGALIGGGGEVLAQRLKPPRQRAHLVAPRLMRHRRADVAARDGGERRLERRQHPQRAAHQPPRQRRRDAYRRKPFDRRRDGGGAPGGGDAGLVGADVEHALDGAGWPVDRRVDGEILLAQDHRLAAIHAAARHHRMHRAGLAELGADRAGAVGLHDVGGAAVELAVGGVAHEHGGGLAGGAADPVDDRVIAERRRRAPRDAAHRAVGVERDVEIVAGVVERHGDGAQAALLTPQRGGFGVGDGLPDIEGRDQRDGAGANRQDKDGEFHAQ